MKTSAVYNHQRRLINKLQSVYYFATVERLKHSELCLRVGKEIWSDPGLKRCPSYVHSVLMQTRETLSQQIYSHLIWAFIGSDGIPRQLNSLTEEDRQKVFSGDIKGTYYWLKTAKTVETLTDGSIVEIITKTPTLSAF
jgi:hypothetical protein